MRKRNSCTVDTDTVIIGAGFAGLSTAYHLAKKGLKDIVVIEHEKKLGGHASGRNAGMIRQAIADPVLGKLACQGRRLLSQCEKKGWKGTKLASNGSLLLAKSNAIDELRKTATILKDEGLSARWLSHQQAVRLVPLLEGGDFEKALFCGSDAMVNIDFLIQGFYHALKHHRVPVLMGHTLRSVKKQGNRFYITAGNKRFIARRLVNAAGAWAGTVARKANATAVPLKAYRRHLFLAKPFRPFDASWPFVWDLTHNFYFRPQQRSLLLSACDKGEIKNIKTAVRKEAIDPKIQDVLRKKLNDFSDKFRSISIQSIKSGLRTMAPDNRFVIGEDPKLKGFFWVAGLGGHGVTTCFSVGNLASDLILRRKVEKVLAERLSPGRFVRIRN